MAIGILDSGLGGYSIYQALHNAYPKASFVFLADQKNAPFGTKTKEALLKITIENIHWFIKQDITMIVIACNTISSTIMPELRDNFPSITLISIVEPTVKMLSNHHHKSILVCATLATTLSKTYETQIKQLLPNCQVYGQALSDLVMKLEDLESEKSIETYLIQELNQYRNNVDTCVLACTHYPIVSHLFKLVLNCEILDSRKPMVDYFKDISMDVGDSFCYTSLSSQHANHQVEVLFVTKEGFLEVSR
jgi:glutamate racemase